MTRRKWVYLFPEVKATEPYIGFGWQEIRGLLGGKGANLADITRISIPVPQGFTISTGDMNTHLATVDEAPDEAWHLLARFRKTVEISIDLTPETLENHRFDAIWLGIKFPTSERLVAHIEADSKGHYHDEGIGSRVVCNTYRHLGRLLGTVVVMVPGYARPCDAIWHVGSGCIGGLNSNPKTEYLAGDSITHIPVRLKVHPEGCRFVIGTRAAKCREPPQGRSLSINLS